MKTTLFIVVGLILGIASGSTIHAADGEIKLIGAGDGALNRARMPVDVVGDVIIVGVHDVDINNILGSGRIYTRIRKNKWEQSAELLAHDRHLDQPKPGQSGFGFAVSLSGRTGRTTADYALIGAPGDNGAAKDAGAAYIYASNGKNWRQEIKLAAGDAAAGDAFGFVVSIDGTTAVVGAPKADIGAAKNAGAAYVFVRDANRWRQHAKLIPKDSARSDALGEAVDIQKDTVIIGAPGHTHGGVRFAGAVFVFVRDGDAWREQAKLTADDAASSDRFGISVDIEGDTVIVGSLLNDAGGTKDAGAAYIFVRNETTWTQQAKLIAPEKRKGDRFGAGVATTGMIAVVGAPLREEDGLGAGAAYSFVNVDGVWKNAATVVPDEPGPNLLLGSTVAISGDTIVLGGGAAPTPHAGYGNGTAAYVYSGEEHFGTPPFAVEPFGLKIETLGQVKRTALLQNFPNPFNPETWLPYRLATDTPVTFRIYNTHGQLMRELDLGNQVPGNYLSRDTAAYWDGRDEHGEMVSSGIYFYTLQAGAFQSTRRMLILK
ncbi:MAG: hypothetical protein OXN17_06985 [Candidatus Poribacteria bacterium]|nr:hypothetical protein [Candidatus Poribacteria bacterium]